MSTYHWKLRTVVAAVGMALMAPIAMAGTSAASANLSSSQSAVGSFDMTAHTANKAKVHGHVLQNASGNVGVNDAAGSNNLQGNNTDIAVMSGAGSATSSVINSQVAIASGTLSLRGHNHASASGHVLQNASGNIGMNVAAGEQNMQGNNLAIADAGANSSSEAVVVDEQVSNRAMMWFPSFAVDMAGHNHASLSGHVLQNA